MRTGKSAALILLPSAFAIATSLIAAQEPAATKPPPQAALAQSMPVDSQITVGRLQNGLRYYIRANTQPANRAELRLVVNAGSILEEDDQLGLAHFVEHMAFNGTLHFPKQEIVAFMESIGMRFGPSVNAFTSFDETVYMLQVPTDKAPVVDRAFLILEDWAQHVSFDPLEIDKERGVITEEWRLRRGAGARMQDQQFPILFKGSRYAERLPIGKMEIVQSFKLERLEKFYADWYRPELMAVIAVGDFDPQAIEGLVKQHFGSIPASAATKLRPSYKVPEQPGTLYAVATDREAPGTSVAVYRKLPARDQTTVGAYRQQMVERLFAGMLSARLSEIAQKPDAPFVGASAGRGRFVRTAEVSTLSALVRQDAIEGTLDVLFTEAERVARFGFTASELDRLKRTLLRSLERAIAEKARQPSAALAAELVRHFTVQEPIPGIEYEFGLHQRFLPGIALEEINRLAKDWVPDRNRVVMVSAPQKEGLTVPDQQKLAAVIASATTKEIKPYVDVVDTQPLLDSLPEPGAIAKNTTSDAAGITEWELSNGARVVLKPTTFKQDEVLFRATSPGGTSLAADQDYVAASTAAQVIASGGVGKFSAIELRKMLSAKVVSVRPIIGETEEGLTGSASRSDLETMFQLIYLTFTQPRADPTIFSVTTGQMRSMLANQQASPEFVFAEMLGATLSQNHPRARPMTPERVGEMNLDKSFAFYKDRFGDASDFTFVFVGSFDLQTMKPLVERYLGALPSIHRKESWKDVGIHAPRGIIERRVDKGIEPKSRANIVFTGPFQNDQTQRVAIRAMGQVLEARLRETLREELGGTYSVSASAAYSRIPREQYRVAVAFGCGPERTEELVKGVFREIELLKSNGPTEKQVNDVKEALLRDFETSSKVNAYLVSELVLKYQSGEDPATIFALPDYYRKLTATVIQDAARKYLDTNNYVKVTLFPETKQEPRRLFEHDLIAIAR